MASSLKDLLLEKVSKKEIDEILNSRDVVVGAEFEFKLDADIVREFSSNSTDYENAMDNWYRYVEEWGEYKEELEKYTEQKEEHDDWTDRKADAEAEGKEFDEEEPIIMVQWPMIPDPPEYGTINYSTGEPREEPNEYDFQLKESELYERVEEYVKDYVKSNKKLNFVLDWDFKEDTSLTAGDGGIEIASKPEPIQDYMKHMELVFDMIDDIGYTDIDCGFHVGVSLTHGMKEVDQIKLCLFTEEEYIWKIFNGRELSTYAVSMKPIIRNLAIKQDRRPWYATEKDALDTIEKLVDVSKAKAHAFQPDHYHGVNIEHLSSNSLNSYVEFRYIGGKDYHRKYQEIKTIIARYAYALKVACQPEFKKKEYVLKVDRILRKIEAFVIRQEIDELENTEQNEPEAVTAKKIKNLVYRLQFLPKLTEDEETQMRRYAKGW